MEIQNKTKYTLEELGAKKPQAIAVFRRFEGFTEEEEKSWSDDRSDRDHQTEFRGLRSRIANWSVLELHFFVKAGENPYKGSSWTKKAQPVREEKEYAGRPSQGLSRPYPEKGVWKLSKKTVEVEWSGVKSPDTIECNGVTPGCWIELPPCVKIEIHSLISHKKIGVAKTLKGAEKALEKNNLNKDNYKLVIREKK